MTENEAFLAAIMENPRDDTPKLVYSDWLEERGDPSSMARSEYIRRSIQGWPWSDRHLQELDEKYGHEWPYFWSRKQKAEFPRMNWIIRGGFTDFLAGYLCDIQPLLLQQQWCPPKLRVWTVSAAVHFNRKHTYALATMLPSHLKSLFLTGGSAYSRALRSICQNMQQLELLHFEMLNSDTLSALSDYPFSSLKVLSATQFYGNITFAPLTWMTPLTRLTRKKSKLPIWLKEAFKEFAMEPSPPHPRKFEFIRPGVGVAEHYWLAELV